MQRAPRSTRGQHQGWGWKTIALGIARGCPAAKSVMVRELKAGLATLSRLDSFAKILWV
jgi:hypothetical protein